MKAAKHGFTLLEVMLAIAIFTTVSIMGYNILSTVVDTDSFTKERSNRLAEIQRAFWIIANDLRQISDRGIAVTEEQHLPALLTGENNSSTDDAEFYEDEYIDPDFAEDATMNSIPYLIEFTRRGWSNPLNTPRSEMQRVAYELAFDFYDDDESDEEMNSEDNWRDNRYSADNRLDSEGYLDDDEFINQEQGGVLIRHYWVALDHVQVEVPSGENEQEPIVTEPEIEDPIDSLDEDSSPAINDLRPVSKQQILLTGVQSVQFRFMDEEGEWHSSWPLESDLDDDEVSEDGGEVLQSNNNTRNSNSRNNSNRDNSAENNSSNRRANRGPKGPLSGESGVAGSSRSRANSRSNNSQNPFRNIINAVENARNRDQSRQESSIQHSLPKVIEISMNVQPYGKITRLFRVNRFPLQEPSQEEENLNNNNRQRNNNSRNSNNRNNNPSREPNENSRESRRPNERDSR